MTSHAARSDKNPARQSGILRVRATRRAMLLPVVIMHRGERFEGTTLNLGIGGAFIETLLQPNFEAQVEIILHPPTVVGELRLPAVVRWRKPGGIGVHFLSLGAVETHAVTSLMRAQHDISKQAGLRRAESA
jgi:hypothetical protein